MTPTECWTLVDAARAATAADPMALGSAVREGLGRRTVEDIHDWHEWLEEQMGRFDPAVFMPIAAQLMGSCSDDGFEDFLGWLIGQGEAFVERTVSQPQWLLTLRTRAPGQRDDRFNGESLVYAHAEAYEAITGEQWDA